MGNGNRSIRHLIDIDLIYVFFFLKNQNATPVLKRIAGISTWV